MIKILLTGDVHLGRIYQKEEQKVAERFIQARFQSLENAIQIANKEACDFFIIAGDLFDKVKGIPVSLHKQVSRILGEFLGEAVLILPGNHDYLDEKQDQLWKKFEEYSPSNTRVFHQNEKYQIGQVCFYPCICHDKHSKENALGWLNQITNKNPREYHLGIAHGAIEGLSYDKNQDYYYMTQRELAACEMDAWLIGHTHVPYPENPKESLNHRIYNAGTPQQTDIADHSIGEVFIIEIEEDKSISARKEKTSVIQFVQREVTVSREDDLEKKLLFSELDKENTSLRVSLSGTASVEDYENRRSLYEKLRQDYLKLEIEDSQLRKEVTPEMIKKETMDGSVISRLLYSYLDEDELLNLAYDLAVSCKGGN